MLWIRMVARQPEGRDCHSCPGHQGGGQQISSSEFELSAPHQLRLLCSSCPGRFLSAPGFSAGTIPDHSTPGTWRRPPWQVWWYCQPPLLTQLDRKSTRLNSSHLVISYAVFCLKKKNN